MYSDEVMGRPGVLAMIPFSFYRFPHESLGFKRTWIPSFHADVFGKAIHQREDVSPLTFSVHLCQDAFTRSGTSIVNCSYLWHWVSKHNQTRSVYQHWDHCEPATNLWDELHHLQQKLVWPIRQTSMGSASAVGWSLRSHDPELAWRQQRVSRG